MTALTRPAASAAVEPLGWRLILGFLQTVVAVGSLTEAQQVASAAIAACGADADAHLRVDLRPGRVELPTQTSVLHLFGLNVGTQSQETPCFSADIASH